MVLKEAPFKISAVTYMEIVQGMRNKKELSIFKKLIKILDIDILQIDTDISKMAISLVEQFYLSDSMQMADALIASVCLKYNETLCTGNEKHFKPIKALSLEIFRP